MKTTNIHPHSKEFLLLVRRTTILLAAALFLLPGAARAADVTVACPGGTPPDFPSIKAALASLDVIGPHRITVTGTCVERVRLSYRDRVTIEAPVGQTATINTPTGTPVRIIGSRGIILRRLVITGGGMGVWINRASEVTIEGTTIENNTGVGLTVYDNSTVFLGGNSPEEFVQIRDNGGSGIYVWRSVLRVSGFTTVLADATAGVRLRGSTAYFSGENSIQNSGGYGVGVFRASEASFSGNVDSGFTIIEGSELGVNVAASSSAYFSGPHKIRNNGSPGLTGTRRGGLRVGSTSNIDLSGAEISNNIGPGVRVGLNGVLGLGNTSNTNNTEEGVLLVRGAVAIIRSGTTIAGNGRANIACDSTSLLATDDPANLAGISKIKCDNVEAKPGKPPRP
jgi:hypothetical protein